MIRRYLAEFLGTFAIVFFGCGAIATLRDQVGSHLMVNTVFGLVVAASIYALGHISAAHFNPAVTIAFAMAGRFPWKFAPAYIGAQFAGATLASGFHLLLIPSQAIGARFGATVPQSDLGRSVIMEGVLTFFLMLVIVSVATDRRVNGAVSGLAIGMAVALCGLVGGPVTGCSMNPARSLGPALFAQGTALHVYWIYMIGPVVGAVLAAFVYESVGVGEEYRQSAPNDLVGTS